MDYLANLKIMLGFADADTSQDAKLNLIIQNAQSALLTKLPNDTTIPDELVYIVVELAIIRFNKIGNEGMSSFGQEGETITYSSNDDLEQFDSAINGYLNSQTDPIGSIGKVVFK